MPIYEYEPVDSPGCGACDGGFELRLPLGRPDPTHCPVCKRPVRKVISLAQTPRISKPLSVSDAKKAGFQVFKKRDKGVYERE